jgi:V8-like Glu-specific endopeptidase
MVIARGVCQVPSPAPKLIKRILFLVLGVIFVGQIEILAQAVAATRAVEDKRVPVDRLAVNPQHPEFSNMNGIGIISVDGVSFDGSGFKVDACHVLTNAHVAYRNLKNMPINEAVRFSVGQTGILHAPFQFDLMPGRVIARGEPNETRERENRDWAVIRLAGKLPPGYELIPGIPIAQISPRELAGLHVTTAGFPGDKIDGGKDFRQIYADLDCKIIDTAAWGFFNHTCQNTGGQSGSPIIYTESGKSYALGMVAGSNGDDGLDKTEDTLKSQLAVSFSSSDDPSFSSEGDKIMDILAADKCE